MRVDDREELRPGAKYYYWEARGVPVRVEVGAREAKGGYVTLVRRDTLEKRSVEKARVAEEVGRLLDEIYRDMKDRAWAYLRERVKRTSSLDEAREWIANRRGVVEVPWCGREECAVHLEDELEAKALGTPWPLEPAPEDARCPVCGRKAVTWMRYAKSY